MEKTNDVTNLKLRKKLFNEIDKLQKAYAKLWAISDDIEKSSDIELKEVLGGEIPSSPFLDSFKNEDLKLSSWVSSLNSKLLDRMRDSSNK